MCIASCKYCDTPCGCVCHTGQKAPEGRLHNTIYAAVSEAVTHKLGEVQKLALTQAVLDALLTMPRTMPDRAANRLEEWLDSDRPDATIFRQTGHLAVDLRVLINEFRSLREDGPH